MPAFEIMVVLVTLIGVIGASAIVKIILNYLRDRQAPKGDSLKASELEAMMQRAVEKANAPLLARLDAVEERLDDLDVPRLMPADDARLIDVAEREEAAEASTPQRRRIQ